MNKKICVAAFFLGLVAVCWVAVGYIGSHPLAFAMTLVIATVYGLGALELRRFDQATATLSQALAAIPEGLEHLGDWLGQVHPSLQNPVRLRIEGERVSLPGPAVTPYLVGLLVLLGMLGTFLGMVVTLNGAVIALESTTDLQTIRAALAAPVKGLGVAFGTSVAGVAASAMLGLISVLCRRERLQASQFLDTRIATVLRGFSLAQQRQETFKALQFQAQALPQVVDKLQAMMAQMEKHSQELSERLLASQESFYREAQGLYSGLASSVDQSLKESLTESARLAGATIQPVAEATMAGIARETATLHEKLADTVKLQLDGLSERFGTTVATVAETWTGALAQHERTSGDLAAGLRESLAAFAGTFEERSAALLAKVAEAQATQQADLAARDQARQAALAQSLEAMAATLQQEWQEAGVQNLARQEQICRTLEQTAGDLAARDQARQAVLAQSLEAMAATLQREWQQTGEQNRAQQEQICRTLEQTAGNLAARDEARQAALTQSLETMAATLQQEWQEAGAQNLARQEQICRTLEQTARDITAQAQDHAGQTIAEVARLMQTAAEAPRAAAEVVGQLRQELSASMARDNTLLEERARIMETLGALLDTINHASTEQRGAIDALVSSSAAILERAGARFTEEIQAEAARMADAAAQITGGAVEVASLSEAFDQAVQVFSAANEKLVASLERIEGSLGKSMARSDEQLAYYVAQAREIIDLSIMSQKQIVEDLQQFSRKQAGEEVC